MLGSVHIAMAIVPGYCCYCLVPAKLTSAERLGIISQGEDNVKHRCCQAFVTFYFTQCQLARYLVYCVILFVSPGPLRLHLLLRDIQLSVSFENVIATNDNIFVIIYSNVFLLIF